MSPAQSDLPGGGGRDAHAIAVQLAGPESRRVAAAGLAAGRAACRAGACVATV